MNLQQDIQSRSASNGYGRRRGNEDFGPKFEGKSQYVKTDFNFLTGTGQEGGGSQERLVYLNSCLIGHNVEVQVLDGSVFSGIFHATDAEKDFGIILKMARLIKDCSRRQKGTSDIVNGPPTKIMIIPSKELAQIIGKCAPLVQDVPVTRSGLAGELQWDKQQELLIDSSISKSRFVDSGRELERWVPDDDDPGCPELENIFDGPWNRGWDQFEVNRSLFGVKSTFVEELYTTKLERGPRTKELEREAVRIAKEIEGEATYDLHLAEERGMIFNDNLEIDEETRFSSVFRGVDDSGYDDCDDILLDAQNDKTFEGGYSSAVGKSIAELVSWKPTDGALASTRPFLAVEHSSQSTSGKDLHESGSDNSVRLLSSGQAPKNALHLGDNTPFENQFSEHTINNHSEDGHALSEGIQLSKPYESQSVGLSASATAYAPSGASSKGQEKTSHFNDPSGGTRSSKAHVAAQSASSNALPSSSASSTSEFGGVTTASRVLSPSSSMGSLSSERSTLNANAKEFKLNPNAKSFLPSQTQQLRPASPVSEGSFYYQQGNVGPGAHMTSLPPVGIGIGPSYAPNPQVVFNPPSGPPPPQPYFHQNGPQYGQQHMMIGQPRQMFYMPTYPPDMHYNRGREF